MNSEQWKKVKGLFEAALELTPAEREKFLREKCGDDENLYNEVISLLKADHEPHRILEGQALDAVDLGDDFAPEGSRIGPYRIIRQIGFGGMGAVYLAERDDGQFRQKVALKIIKRGMDTDAILKRFHSERQILAGLNHPNIARMYDGGVTESGVPYFTMEYIEGKPIDEYCDNRRLNLRERIRLFRKACAAVAYAQRSLIVHRDLKPSNIVVNTEGEVKLLDFGIAKVLSEDVHPEEFSVLTKTGIRVMTPGYAAPEQIRGEAVSTATDVYALGIVLYELLTGYRPYQTDTGSPAELENIVCNTDPVKPSSLVLRKGKWEGYESDQKDSPKSIRVTRRASPEKLRRMLRGDLDTICLTALRKEPDRRYASAEQLDDDLGHYLKGQPIKARKDSTGYYFRKFISRHRFSLTAAAIFFAVITSLVVYYTVRLRTERDFARTETEKAQQVSKFLAGMFEAADPNEAKGKEITAGMLLEDGARRIREDLKDQPEIQAALMTTIGDVYFQLSRLEECKAMYYDALVLNRKLYGEHDPRTAKAYHDVGGMWHEYDQFDSAMAYYRKAFIIDSAAYGMSDTVTITDYNAIAIVTRHMGKFKEAEPMLRKVLAIRRKILDKNNLDIAYTLNHLGRMLAIEERYDEAIPLLREGLRIREHNLGEKHFEVIASKGALAGALKDEGKLEESDRIYRSCLATLIEMVGYDHQYVGAMMNNVASLAMLRGDYEGADTLFRKSIEILDRALPEDHVSRSQPLLGYGQLLTRMGHPREGEKYLFRALDLRERHYGTDHYKTALVKLQLGICYIAEEQYAEAEPFLLDAYQVLYEQYGADHDHTRLASDKLAELYRKMGEKEKAAQYLSAR